MGSSFIKDIIQDSQGFLWVCTRDGLSRFDGNKFITYKISDGLPNTTINAIMENEDGTFWVATNGGGVCKFDPAGKLHAENNEKVGKLFTAYLLGSTENANRANVLYKAREGNIYVGTDEGLFRLDMTGNDVQIQPIKLNLSSWGSKPLPPVNTILQDHLGNMWFSLQQFGLYRIFPDGRTQHYTVQEYPRLSRVQALLEDRQGRLWIGTETGLGVLDTLPDSEKLPIRFYTQKEGLTHPVINHLVQTRDGHLWVGSQDGLFEYDGQNFRAYGSKNGLLGTDVIRLKEDRNGNLWVGTQSSGLLKFSRHGFITYDSTDALGLANMHTAFEDEAGNFFAVSNDWLIHQFTSEKVISTRLNMPVGAQIGWLSNALVRDHTGEFWAIADGLGVYRFAKVNQITELLHAKPEAVYTTGNGLANTYLRRGFEDSKGNIWFQSASIASIEMVWWERVTATFHRFTKDNGIPAQTNWSAAYEDKFGNIWFGFGDGKLFRFTQGQFVRFNTEGENLTGSITALFLDSQNRLWIADSQKGVILVETPFAEQSKQIRYTPAEGLSSDNARCIGEDQWGRIYIGTVRGVDRIDTTTGEIQHFSSADGLSSDFTKFIYRDRQNNLWIGTLKGISKYNPEPPVKSAPPEVVVSGLRIAGESQAINELGETKIENLEIETGRNQVQIDFTAPAFGVGENLRFQYKLEGANQDWSPLTDLRTVNYANLSPGSYRFLVQAINGEGRYSLEPAIVSFRILFPVWQRWWFIALSVLFLSGVVATVIRSRAARRHERRQAEWALRKSREERLLELEQVRRRIATDLHDDVGSSLTQISLLSEVVRQSIDSNGNGSPNGNGNGSAVSRPLTLISQISQELVDSMSDIVWAINPNKDTLKDLSQRMRHFASDVLTARHIEFRFRTPDEDEEQGIKVGANLRREVYLLFKEAVNNLVKHSHCTQAEIELRLEVDTLFLEIKDDGQGFDVEQESQGNGLQSMSERSRSLGGELEIETGEGKGTRLSFMIPLSQQSRIVNR